MTKINIKKFVNSKHKGNYLIITLSVHVHIFLMFSVLDVMMFWVCFIPC